MYSHPSLVVVGLHQKKSQHGNCWLTRNLRFRTLPTPFEFPYYPNYLQSAAAMGEVAQCITSWTENAASIGASVGWKSNFLPTHTSPPKFSQLRHRSQKIAPACNAVTSLPRRHHELINIHAREDVSQSYCQFSLRYLAASDDWNVMAAPGKNWMNGYEWVWPYGLKVSVSPAQNHSGTFGLMLRHSYVQKDAHLAVC